MIINLPLYPSVLPFLVALLVLPTLSVTTPSTSMSVQVQAHPGDKNEAVQVPIPSSMCFLQLSHPFCSAHNTNSLQFSWNINVQTRPNIQILTTFKQILELSTIIDLEIYQQKLFCLLGNGTLLVFNIHKGETVTLKMFSTDQLPINDTLIDSLIYANFIVNATDHAAPLTLITHLHQLQITLGSDGIFMEEIEFDVEDFQSAHVAFQNQIVFSRGTQGITLYTANNRLEYQLSHHFDSSFFGTVDAISTLSWGKDYLVVLNAIKGVTIIKYNAQTPSKSVIVFTSDLNNEQKCESLTIGSDAVYYSCWGVRKVVNIGEGFKEEPVELDAQMFVSNLVFQSNYLLVASWKHLLLFWNQHLIARYEPILIEKLLFLGNDSILVSAENSIKLLKIVHETPMVSCSIPEREESGQNITFQGKLQYQKENTSQVQTQTVEVTVTIIPKQSNRVMEVALAVIILLTIFIFIAILYSFKELRKIHKDESKTKKVKYSEMLEDNFHEESEYENSESRQPQSDLQRESEQNGGADREFLQETQGEVSSKD